VIVYVTRSHDTTVGLLTVFLDHKSIIGVTVQVPTEIAVPQLLLLKLLSSAIHTVLRYVCPKVAVITLA
jgi:hypothetical protein